MAGGSMQRAARQSRGRSGGRAGGGNSAEGASGSFGDRAGCSDTEEERFWIEKDVEFFSAINPRLLGLLHHHKRSSEAFLSAVLPYLRSRSQGHAGDRSAGRNSPGEPSQAFALRVPVGDFLRRGRKSGDGGARPPVADACAEAVQDKARDEGEQTADDSHKRVASSPPCRSRSAEEAPPDRDASSHPVRSSSADAAGGSRNLTDEASCLSERTPPPSLSPLRRSTSASSLDTPQSVPAGDQAGEAAVSLGLSASAAAPVDADVPRNVPNTSRRSAASDGEGGRCAETRPSLSPSRLASSRPRTFAPSLLRSAGPSVPNCLVQIWPHHTGKISLERPSYSGETGRIVRHMWPSNLLVDLDPTALASPPPREKKAALERKKQGGRSQARTAGRVEGEKKEREESCLSSEAEKTGRPESRATNRLPTHSLFTSGDSPAECVGSKEMRGDADESSAGDAEQDSAAPCARRTDANGSPEAEKKESHERSRGGAGGGSDGDLEDHQAVDEHADGVTEELPGLVKQETHRGREEGLCSGRKSPGGQASDSCRLDTEGRGAGETGDSAVRPSNPPGEGGRAGKASRRGSVECCEARPAGIHSTGEDDNGENNEGDREKVAQDCTSPAQPSLSKCSQGGREESLPDADKSSEGLYSRVTSATLLSGVKREVEEREDDSKRVKPAAVSLSGVSDAKVSPRKGFERTISPSEMWKREEDEKEALCLQMNKNRSIFSLVPGANDPVLLTSLHELQLNAHLKYQSRDLTVFSHSGETQRRAASAPRAASRLGSSACGGGRAGPRRGPIFDREETGEGDVFSAPASPAGRTSGGGGRERRLALAGRPRRSSDSESGFAHFRQVGTDCRGEGQAPARRRDGTFAPLHEKASSRLSGSAPGEKEARVSARDPSEKERSRRSSPVGREAKAVLEGGEEDLGEAGADDLFVPTVNKKWNGAMRLPAFPTCRPPDAFVLSMFVPPNVRPADFPADTNAQGDVSAFLAVVMEAATTTSADWDAHAHAPAPVDGSNFAEDCGEDGEAETREEDGARASTAKLVSMSLEPADRVSPRGSSSQEPSRNGEFGTLVRDAERSREKLKSAGSECAPRPVSVRPEAEQHGAAQRRDLSKDGGQVKSPGGRRRRRSSSTGSGGERTSGKRGTSKDEKKRTPGTGPPVPLPPRSSTGRFMRRESLPETQTEPSSSKPRASLSPSSAALLFASPRKRPRRRLPLPTVLSGPLPAWIDCAEGRPGHAPVSQGSRGSSIPLKACARVSASLACCGPVQSAPNGACGEVAPSPCWGRPAWPEKTVPPFHIFGNGNPGTSGANGESARGGDPETLCWVEPAREKQSPQDASARPSPSIACHASPSKNGPPSSPSSAVSASERGFPPRDAEGAGPSHAASPPSESACSGSGSGAPAAICSPPPPGVPSAAPSAPFSMRPPVRSVSASGSSLFSFPGPAPAPYPASASPYSLPSSFFGPPYCGAGVPVSPVAASYPPARPFASPDAHNLCSGSAQFGGPAFPAGAAPSSPASSSAPTSEPAPGSSPGPCPLACYRPHPYPPFPPCPPGKPFCSLGHPFSPYPSGMPSFPRPPCFSSAPPRPGHSTPSSSSFPSARPSTPGPTPPSCSFPQPCPPPSSTTSSSASSSSSSSSSASSTASSCAPPSVPVPSGIASATLSSWPSCDASGVAPSPGQLEEASGDFSSGPKGGDWTRPSSLPPSAFRFPAPSLPPRVSPGDMALGGPSTSSAPPGSLPFSSFPPFPCPPLLPPGPVGDCFGDPRGMAPRDFPAFGLRASSPTASLAASLFPPPSPPAFPGSSAPFAPASRCASFMSFCAEPQAVSSPSASGESLASCLPAPPPEILVPPFFGAKSSLKPFPPACCLYPPEMAESFRYSEKRKMMVPSGVRLELLRAQMTHVDSRHTFYANVETGKRFFSERSFFEIAKENARRYDAGLQPLSLSSITSPTAVFFAPLAPQTEAACSASPSSQAASGGKKGETGKKDGNEQEEREKREREEERGRRDLEEKIRIHMHGRHLVLMLEAPAHLSGAHRAIPLPWEKTVAGISSPCQERDGRDSHSQALADASEVDAPRAEETGNEVPQLKNPASTAGGSMARTEAPEGKDEKTDSDRLAAVPTSTLSAGTASPACSSAAGAACQGDSVEVSGGGDGAVGPTQRVSLSGVSGEKANKERKEGTGDTAVTKEDGEEHNRIRLETAGSVAVGEGEHAERVCRTGWTDEERRKGDGGLGCETKDGNGETRRSAREQSEGGQGGEQEERLENPTRFLALHGGEKENRGENGGESAGGVYVSVHDSNKEHDSKAGGDAAGHTRVKEEDASMTERGQQNEAMEVDGKQSQEEPREEEEDMVVFSKKNEAACPDAKANKEDETCTAKGRLMASTAFGTEVENLLWRFAALMDEKRAMCARLLVSIEREKRPDWRAWAEVEARMLRHYIEQSAKSSLDTRHTYTLTQQSRDILRLRISCTSSGRLPPEWAERALCTVCGSGEDWDEDPIMFCDGCYQPVHFLCLGHRAVSSYEEFVKASTTRRQRRVAQAGGDQGLAPATARERGSGPKRDKKKSERAKDEKNKPRGSSGEASSTSLSAFGGPQPGPQGQIDGASNDPCAQRASRLADGEEPSGANPPADSNHARRPVCGAGGFAFREDEEEWLCPVCEWLRKQLPQLDDELALAAIRLAAGPRSLGEAAECRGSYVGWHFERLERFDSWVRPQLLALQYGDGRRRRKGRAPADSGALGHGRKDNRHGRRDRGTSASEKGAGFGLHSGDADGVATLHANGAYSVQELLAWPAVRVVADGGGLCANAAQSSRSSTSRGSAAGRGPGAFGDTAGAQGDGSGLALRTEKDDQEGRFRKAESEEGGSRPGVRGAGPKGCISSLAQTMLGARMLPAWATDEEAARSSSRGSAERGEFSAAGDGRRLGGGRLGDRSAELEDELRRGKGEEELGRDSWSRPFSADTGGPSAGKGGRERHAAGVSSLAAPEDATPAVDYIRRVPYTFSDSSGDEGPSGKDGDTPILFCQYTAGSPTASSPSSSAARRTPTQEDMQTGPFAVSREGPPSNKFSPFSSFSPSCGMRHNAHAGGFSPSSGEPGATLTSKNYCSKDPRRRCVVRVFPVPGLSVVLRIPVCALCGYDAFCRGGGPARKSDKKGVWTHLRCALSLNATVTDRVSYEADESRSRLRCLFCHYQGPAPGQCGHAGCQRTYHVSCATATPGCMVDWDMGRPVIFCSQHAKNKAPTLILRKFQANREREAVKRREEDLPGEWKFGNGKGHLGITLQSLLFPSYDGLCDVFADLLGLPALRLPALGPADAETPQRLEGGASLSGAQRSDEGEGRECPGVRLSKETGMAAKEPEQRTETEREAKTSRKGEGEKEEESAADSNLARRQPVSGDAGDQDDEEEGRFARKPSCRRRRRVEDSDAEEDLGGEEKEKAQELSRVGGKATEASFDTTARECVMDGAFPEQAKEAVEAGRSMDKSDGDTCASEGRSPKNAGSGVGFGPRDRGARVEEQGGEGSEKAVKAVGVQESKVECSSSARGALLENSGSGASEKSAFAAADARAEAESQSLDASESEPPHASFAAHARSQQPHEEAQCSPLLAASSGDATSAGGNVSASGVVKVRGGEERDSEARGGLERTEEGDGRSDGAQPDTAKESGNLPVDDLRAPAAASESRSFSGLQKVEEENGQQRTQGTSCAGQCAAPLDAWTCSASGAMKPTVAASAAEEQGGAENVPAGTSPSSPSSCSHERGLPVSSDLLREDAGRSGEVPVSPPAAQAEKCPADAAPAKARESEEPHGEEREKTTERRDSLSVGNGEDAWGAAGGDGDMQSSSKGQKGNSEAAGLDQADAACPVSTARAPAAGASGDESGLGRDGDGGAVSAERGEWFAESESKAETTHLSLPLRPDECAPAASARRFEGTDDRCLSNGPTPSTAGVSARVSSCDSGDRTEGKDGQTMEGHLSQWKACAARGGGLSLAGEGGSLREQRGVSEDCVGLSAASSLPDVDSSASRRLDANSPVLPHAARDLDSFAASYPQNGVSRAASGQGEGLPAVPELAPPFCHTGGLDSLQRPRAPTLPLSRGDWGEASFFSASGGGSSSANAPPSSTGDPPPPHRKRRGRPPLARRSQGATHQDAMKRHADRERLSSYLASKNASAGGLSRGPLDLGGACGDKRRSSFHLAGRGAPNLPERGPGGRFLPRGHRENSAQTPGSDAGSGRFYQKQRPGSLSEFAQVGGDRRVGDSEDESENAQHENRELQAREEALYQQRMRQMQILFQLQTLARERHRKLLGNDFELTGLLGSDAGALGLGYPLQAGAGFPLSPLHGNSPSNFFAKRVPRLLDSAAALAVRRTSTIDSAATAGEQARSGAPGEAGRDGAAEESAEGRSVGREEGEAEEKKDSVSTQGACDISASSGLAEVEGEAANRGKVTLRRDGSACSGSLLASFSSPVDFLRLTTIKDWGLPHHTGDEKLFKCAFEETKAADVLGVDTYDRFLARQGVQNVARLLDAVVDLLLFFLLRGVYCAGPSTALLAALGEGKAPAAAPSRPPSLALALEAPSAGERATRKATEERQEDAERPTLPACDEEPLCALIDAVRQLGRGAELDFWSEAQPAARPKEESASDSSGVARKHVGLKPEAPGRQSAEPGGDPATSTRSAEDSTKAFLNRVRHFNRQQEDYITVCSLCGALGKNSRAAKTGVFSVPDSPSGSSESPSGVAYVSSAFSSRTCAASVVDLLTCRCCNVRVCRACWAQTGRDAPPSFAVACLASGSLPTKASSQPASLGGASSAFLYSRYGASSYANSEAAARAGRLQRRRAWKATEEDDTDEEGDEGKGRVSWALSGKRHRGAKEGFAGRREREREEKDEDEGAERDEKTDQERHRRDEQDAKGAETLKGAAGDGDRDREASRKRALFSDAQDQEDRRLEEDEEDALELRRGSRTKSEKSAVSTMATRRRPNASGDRENEKKAERQNEEESDWTCLRCEAVLNACTPFPATRCILCSRIDGLLVRRIPEDTPSLTSNRKTGGTSVSSSFASASGRQNSQSAAHAHPADPPADRKEEQWVHWLCAEWLVPSRLAATASENIRSIPKQAFEKPCLYCGIQQGATLACCSNGFRCSASFHVSCARQLGCRMETQRRSLDQQIHRAYCLEHTTQMNRKLLQQRLASHKPFALPQRKDTWDLNRFFDPLQLLITDPIRSITSLFLVGIQLERAPPPALPSFAAFMTPAALKMLGEKRRERLSHVEWKKGEKEKRGREDFDGATKGSRLDREDAVGSAHPRLGSGRREEEDGSSGNAEDKDGFFEAARERKKQRHDLADGLTGKRAGSGSSRWPGDRHGGSSLQSDAEGSPSGDPLLTPGPPSPMHLEEQRELYCTGVAICDALYKQSRAFEEEALELPSPSAEADAARALFASEPATPESRERRSWLCGYDVTDGLMDEHEQTTAGRSSRGSTSLERGRGGSACEPGAKRRRVSVSGGPGAAVSPGEAASKERSAPSFLTRSGLRSLSGSHASHFGESEGRARQSATPLDCEKRVIDPARLTWSPQESLRRPSFLARPGLDLFTLQDGEVLPEPALTFSTDSEAQPSEKGQRHAGAECRNAAGAGTAQSEKDSRTSPDGSVACSHPETRTSASPSPPTPEADSPLTSASLASSTFPCETESLVMPPYLLRGRAVDLPQLARGVCAAASASARLASESWYRGISAAASVAVAHAVQAVSRGRLAKGEQGQFETEGEEATDQAGAAGEKQECDQAVLDVLATNLQIGPPGQVQGEKQPIFCPICKGMYNELPDGGPGDGFAWVGCDCCERWYHWTCSGFNEENPPPDDCDWICWFCTVKIRKEEQERERQAHGLQSKDKKPGTKHSRSRPPLRKRDRSPRWRTVFSVMDVHKGCASEESLVSQFSFGYCVLSAVYLHPPCENDRAYESCV
ncbi:hypothetical protein NCLIV_048300 [Neospora caninum Liverpool]|uniref:PHD-finger domain-containing protein n=1 Tax=Neospora caninum (strain Liverpool) TaxID=572307 RepID=F0VMC3_NEOCL|nr:hypothetical protein NCLIV_048300 [Neospora caninum Liverpool]CBZ54401.1 hypothetical protein NCLIV_048300 [Neospora caninum Liverpool]CEL69108.1 TPA: PHD-finger domain-containing protein [Neospora caninum Liverpool]|eukprot:XP_003884431.1 hypothetical protein NCLIV_048300 [Neospora caninum Liverpool]